MDAIALESFVVNSGSWKVLYWIALYLIVLSILEILVLMEMPERDNTNIKCSTILTKLCNANAIYAIKYNFIQYNTFHAPLSNAKLANTIVSMVVLDRCMPIHIDFIILWLALTCSHNYKVTST